MVTRLVGAGIAAGVGLGVLVLGCILIPVFDLVVYDTVVEAARYENGTDGYDNLLNSTSPTYTYFYFFNLTNREEVMANASVKPVVEEVGPYVYRTLKPKENLEFREDGTKLRYQARSRYFFDKERSEGNDPTVDVIINVNYIILTAAKLLDKLWIPSITGPFEDAIALYGDTIFEEYLVEDYLWGYFDETLNASGLIPTFIDSAEQGIFYGVNDSLGDEFVVHTGTDEIDLVNEVDTWKTHWLVTYENLFGTTLPMWRSSYANYLNGTDGTQFKPFLEDDDVLNIFSSDLCRSFKMLLDSEVDVKGIKAYRYVIDPSNFAITEENKAFCVPIVPNGDNCLPYGLLNVERCYDLAPMVASLPHFYQVDEAVLNAIEGLNPVKEQHQTAIDVEPTTGISIQGNKRLQISAWIREYRLFDDTLGGRFAGNGTIFPMFWLNEQSEISDSDAEAYKNEIIEPLELLEIVQYTVIGVGAFVMLVGLVVFTYFKCGPSRDKSYA